MQVEPYKARKRKEKIEKVTHQIKDENYSPTIKGKEFLSIKESSLLLGVGRWTISRFMGGKTKWSIKKGLKRF